MQNDRRRMLGMAAVAAAWLATSGVVSASDVDIAIARAQETGAPLLILVSSPT